MKFNLPKMNYSILKKIVLVGLLIFYLFIVGTYFLKQFQEGMTDEDKEKEETLEEEEVEELKNKEGVQTIAQPGAAKAAAAAKAAKAAKAK